MTGSISAGWSGGSPESSRVWQDRLGEAQAKAKAVDNRHEVAEDKLAVRQAWQQTTRVPRVSESGSVDMYM
jgi:hypothetical protein